jgi:hypothetical protein
VALFQTWVPSLPAWASSRESPLNENAARAVHSGGPASGSRRGGPAIAHSWAVPSSGHSATNRSFGLIAIVGAARTGSRVSCRPVVASATITAAPASW